MILPGTPRKKIKSILKKIEKERSNESDITFLVEMLNKEPSMVPEVVMALTAMLQGNDTKGFRSAAMALSAVADIDIEAVSDYMDVIVSCIPEDTHTDEIPEIFEILFKIFQKYPDQMGIAVPALIKCLRSMNSTVREKAYLLLGPTADKYPVYFKGLSKELIHALNGLNVDGRVFACKLIGKIAEKDLKIVEDTYDALKYIYINHPSRELRLEASSAIDKVKSLQEKEARKMPLIRGIIINPEDCKTATDLDLKINKFLLKRPEEIYTADETELQTPASEFIELMEPSDEDLIEALNGLGLQHLIEEGGPPPTHTEKEPVNGETPDQKEPGVGEEERKFLETVLQKTISTGVIKSAMIIDNEGNMLAVSGPPIDGSLLSNLRGMFSYEINDKFRSRVSLEDADKKIVAIRFNSGNILIAMTDANTPIGMVIHELNKSIEKMDNLVDF